MVEWTRTGRCNDISLGGTSAEPGGDGDGRRPLWTQQNDSGGDGQTNCVVRTALRVWLMIVMIAVYIMVVRKVFMQENARVYIYQL